MFADKSFDRYAGWVAGSGVVSLALRKGLDESESRERGGAAGPELPRF